MLQTVRPLAEAAQLVFRLMVVALHHNRATKVYRTLFRTFHYHMIPNCKLLYRIHLLVACVNRKYFQFEKPLLGTGNLRSSSTSCRGRTLQFIIQAALLNCC